jgi:c-di-AMP phosphodiesterase-like protein
MLYFWDTYSPAFEQGVMTDFSPVIAVVSVDNYDDLTDNLSDAEQSQVNSFIASFIADFAQSKKIFYRRADKDRFYLFTDYFVLNELIADKFSVLDKFREEAKANGLALTLSIGISYGNHDHQDIGRVA